jgi:heat shock protein HtpX
MKWLKTFSLLIVLSALVVGVASIFGPQAAIVALIFVFIMNFVMFWFSDKLALSMAGAKPVTEQQEPQLHWLVGEVARKAGMPKPKVYVINNDSPNAFATGRGPGNAVVAVTTGIRRLLSEGELEGVIAHEMAHIKNRDMLIMTIVAVLAGVISFLAMMAQWSLIFGGLGGNRRDSGAGAIGIIALLLTAILMPLAASIIRFAISRTREYAADETGARILGNPLPLAAALEKLDGSVRMRPMRASAANEAMAHMFIVNPLGAQAQHANEAGGGFVSLFSTHPPIADRVRRLRAMAMG